MSDTHDRRDDVEPDGDGAPEQIADEQFVHGLLEFLRRDGDRAQSRRVERVMEAIGGGEPAAPLAAARRVPWALVATLAAAVLVVVTVFGLTRPPSATDLVQRAAEGAGDRRYEVRVFSPQPGDGPMLTALLDVRDADHCLLRAHVLGSRVVLGRTAGYAWSIDPHGETQRLDPGRDGHWLVLDHIAVLLESVDTMLVHLGRGYALARGGDATLPGHGEKLFERVSARPEGAADGGTPHHIELWLDGETHAVQRMELHWPERSGGPLSPHALHGQHDPHLVHGPPGFADGHHVPPRLIVFELVDRPALAQSWFDPDTHTK